jgi:hypothetical protein
MLILIFFLISNTNAWFRGGELDSYYFNGTMNDSYCSDIEDCYNSICKLICEGDIFKIHMLPFGKCILDNKINTYSDKRHREDINATSARQPKIVVRPSNPSGDSIPFDPIAVYARYNNNTSIFRTNCVGRDDCIAIICLETNLADLYWIIIFAPSGGHWEC